MTKQTITIHHDRKEPGPLCIDHVPPLGADGMNCTLRGNKHMRGDPLRRAVLAINAQGKRPIVVEDSRGNASLRFHDGRSKQGRDSWDDIIALDGQPAEPALVRVDRLMVGALFTEPGGTCVFMMLNTCRYGSHSCVALNHGILTERESHALVRPLAPSEKLVITVTAKGEPT